MNWYLQAIKNYANFSGRARRTEYWMFHLFNSLFILITYLPGWVLARNHSTAGIALIFLIICILYELFVLIPSFAIIVRRLHDQDKSGAWYFISWVPLIGGIWLLVLLCIDGTYGPNQYGEDPKQQDSSPYVIRTPTASSSEHSEPSSFSRINNPNSAFRITSLNLSKMQAAIGEDIEARITYQNNGDELKDYVMTLYLNNAVIHQQQIDIPSHTQGSVAIQLPPVSDIGEYTIKAGSCSQKLVIGHINPTPAVFMPESPEPKSSPSIIHTPTISSPEPSIPKSIAVSAPLHTKPKSIAVSAPAHTEPKSTFRITSVKLSKMQAERGEDIEAKITYQNNGDEIKEYLMTLYVNDAEVHMQHFDIPSHTQGSVDIKVPPISEDGVYTVWAGDCSQMLMIGNIDLAHAVSAFAHTKLKSATVTSPKHAEPKSTFRITSVKLSKMQAAIGEDIEAKITYQNNGDEIKEYLMTLYVNGVVMHKQHFDIPSFTQGSVVIQLPLLPDIGEYTIKVGGCSQKLIIV